MFILTNKGETIFSSFLELLNVKHTKYYADKYYNEHPYKYSLFGLSKMLTDYKVLNTGIKFDNKEDILQLDPPFIAHSGSDFVIVKKISKEKINYSWHNKIIDTSIEEFYKTWTGIVLIAEPDENSAEPKYNEMRKKELFDTAQKVLLFVFSSILMTLAFLYNRIYAHTGLILLLLINLTGLYIGYLLVIKQMHIQSDYADKICSLFRQSDCNNILDSSAAKFIGIIGWSEVGLGYFISNILIILIFPQLIPYLAIINVCSLPYTLWSIWYQRFKAKTWCPLCLIVQLLLWVIFTINLISGYISFPDFTVVAIILTICLYIIPFLIINIITPLLSDSKKVENITHEINSLKLNEDLFRALQKEQTYHQVDKTVSNILFGNIQSDTLITILTNPHCEPCGRIHAQVDHLLSEIGEKICIQYIFSSFGEELEISSKFLIASYFSKTAKEVREIYDKWFGGGKNKKESFFENNEIKTDMADIEEEYSHHKEWIKKTKLSATPTILINGYELHSNYKIEDIKYLV